MEVGLLQRLFETLPTAIAVLSAETQEVRSANRAFLELVGLDSADVLGQRPPYPWWPEGRQSRPADAPHRQESTYVRSDGARIPVELTHVTLASEGGAPLADVVVATDLGGRRRFEQQLAQAGRMAAIGELAAGLAHEINNPLFAILGLVEFLLEDAEPGSRAERRLQLVRQTGLEIKEIVRALLDFAREPSDEVVPVSLADVAAQTVHLVRRASSAKGVELVEHYPEEPLIVEASPAQLKQVFLDLLTNAQQALGDGGRIELRVAAAEGWAQATVSDDGPGIAPDVAARIFDPFFTTKRDLGGTGLGLSASLGIAQLHGGDLSVESAPGEGATFTLRLPLAPEPGA